MRLTRLFRCHCLALAHGTAEVEWLKGGQWSGQNGQWSGQNGQWGAESGQWVSQNGQSGVVSEVVSGMVRVVWSAKRSSRWSVEWSEWSVGWSARRSSGWSVEWPVNDKYSNDR